MTDCDFGLIGLAVMGQNLALNMERNGCRVAVFNRTPDKTHEFMGGAAAGRNFQPTWTIRELVHALPRPRKVLMMVKAGPPVDQVIDELCSYLEPGDLILDGGNSYFRDTERRAVQLEGAGLFFLGVGVSGGEEGALMGPSIMPGGHLNAYKLVEPVLQAISAKVDGEPCVAYMGPRGAGHYVKMVHNGIEYGDMQLIAEAYDLLHRGLGLPAAELHTVFARWNQGVLSSYLIEITSKIFQVKDLETGQPLVDLILDEAGQKGTGKWTSQDALDLGVAIPTINAAVEARILSGDRDERLEASKQLPGLEVSSQAEWLNQLSSLEVGIDAIGAALYASKICSYAQGMKLLTAASHEYGYNLNYGEIARIWQGGCIIRAQFLKAVRRAFEEHSDTASGKSLPNMLLAPYFLRSIQDSLPAWREVVQKAAGMGIALPAMSSSLAYYDSIRSARLPANLIQAQRDFFGAHTYQRLDRPGSFHTEWVDLTD